MASLVDDGDVLSRPPSARRTLPMLIVCYQSGVCQAARSILTAVEIRHFVGHVVCRTGKDWAVRHT